MSHDERRRQATRLFFDDMASTYDRDLAVVGWDPVALVQRWPFLVQPHESVLDVGCGTGAVLATYAGAQRKLFGMDLSPEMIHRARRREELKEADLHAQSADDAWPYPDRAFDAVISLAMFEFIEALDSALDEMVRVLKPGGRALFSVEDVVDWLDVERPRFELRYGSFPLWRRTLEEVEDLLPPGVHIVRSERVRGYEVDELKTITTYLVVEIQKDFE